MTTYVFPGQGSQAVGMGFDLFDQFEELLQTADKILGYSIKTLCTEDPLQQLGQTEYTQPALFVVSALSYFDKVQSVQEKPRFLAGHSLGEYNALLAAEVFDFATGLMLVKKRGELMSAADTGAMAAVVGLQPEVIQHILSTNNLQQVVIANFNTYNQLIISGEKNEVMQAIVLFQEAGAKMAKMLNVSGAFHSPLMEPAQAEFANFLQQFNFSAPKIPVIANVTARPYLPEAIQVNLSAQIANPVRWTESIEYLLAQGETELEEIGPGNVLNGMIRRIKNKQ
jgi:malonyl CoA-acyl carrier protein transacylase